MYGMRRIQRAIAQEQLRLADALVISSQGQSPDAFRAWVGDRRVIAGIR